MTKQRIVGLLVLLLLFGTVTPALAHGYIIRAIPANRSVLERPPTRLQYWFSEGLETRFSTLYLRDASGVILLKGGVDPQNNQLLTLQIPPNTLSEGAYIAELQVAFASDSHVIVESQVFFVGDEVGGIESIAAATTAQPLEVIWKTLWLGGTFVLFGALLLYANVLLPAWGSPQYKLGQLPPRVIGRLQGLLILGFGLAVAAQLIALAQQTMAFFNVGFEAILSGGLWQVVLIGSRFGDMWRARVFFLVLLAGLQIASYVYRQEYPWLLRPVWTANVWLMALIIGTQAVNSHAAGSLVLPWVAMFSQWVHSLAVAFWVGGIVTLVWVLPSALQPYSAEERAAALQPVMQRMSRLLVGTVLIVITSGSYNATNWFYSVGDVATPYGGTLGFKLLLLVLLVGLAAAHHLALRPSLAVRIEQFLARLLPMRIELHVVQFYYRVVNAARTFTGTLRFEAGLALVVLGSAAWLGATPVPQPDFLQNTIPPLSATTTIADFTIHATLAPGAPGVNTLDVVLQQAGQPITNATVEVQIVQPDADRRTRWGSVEPLENGLYVTSTDAFSEIGRWYTLLDIRLPAMPAGEFYRGFFEWQITDAAAVIPNRPPSALNLLALGLLALAVGYLSYPTLKSWTQRLNLHPASLLVAGITIVLALLAIVIGFWVVEQQRLADERLLYPPPQQINPIPPDAESLQRGEILYQEVCLIWQTAPDFQPLLRSLDTLRDEALVKIPAQGWRNVPPCSRVLNETEAWDVVNYLRTRRWIASSAP